mmetsp:Transcript_8189/g.8190  ORF Transcript_8189/g.8190 Transcript_8189/m.8190 type:complete len:390 (+) Transcript_8189:642-1811(+)
MKCTAPLPYSRNSCSGNGYMCSLPEVYCVCYTGWTSHGDFSFDSDGYDCKMHDYGIRILSYFCIIVPSICNLLIIWHYIRQAIRKKRFCIISREYKSMFPFCFLIGGTTSTITGILRVSHPIDSQPLVGRDFSVSLMNCLFTASVFTGLVMYLNLIIEFLERYPHTMMSTPAKIRISKQFRLLGFYSHFIPPGILIIGIFPLISVAYPDKSRELGMTYLIGIGVLAYAYGSILMGCLSFLLKELRMYIDDIEAILSKDIKLIVHRLTAAHIVSGGCSVVFGTLFIVFASSNYLFHLSTYYLLFCYISVPATTIVFVMTVAIVSPSYQVAPQALASPHVIESKRETELNGHCSAFIAVEGATESEKIVMAHSSQSSKHVRIAHIISVEGI